MAKVRFTASQPSAPPRGAHLPQNYLSLPAADKKMVDTFYRALKDNMYGVPKESPEEAKHEPEKDAQREADILRTLSSAQGIKVISDIMAATAAWGKDNKIELPKAESADLAPKDLMERHKLVIKAAHPDFDNQQGLERLRESIGADGFRVLQMAEFLRTVAKDMAEAPPEPRSHKPATGKKGMLGFFGGMFSTSSQTR